MELFILCLFCLGLWCSIVFSFPLVLALLIGLVIFASYARIKQFTFSDILIPWSIAGSTILNAVGVPLA